MHMADGLVAPDVGLAFCGVAGGFLAFAARKVVREPDYERKLPLMGVLGAFVFAAQMINFAVPATGSSGHLAGGLLLSVLVGPYAGFLVMTSVLVVQCLLFADGGLLALGCNAFNLGFWPAFVGLPIYRAVASRWQSARGRSTGAVLAAIVAGEAGALCVVIQTLISGRSDLPLPHFAALMLGIHLPIAVAEGIITAGAIGFTARAGVPGVTAPTRPVRGGGRSPAPVVMGVLGIAVFLATVGVWFASSRPDGLEWAIGRAGGATEEPVAVADRGPSAGEDENSGGGIRPAIDAGVSASGIAGAFACMGLVFLVGGILFASRVDRPGRGGT